ncbi:peptide methionine sulfoxide reductase [Mrakia frigida]|uniref:peptide-methionine (R)-S-oxide reductase n=1 Tax=Mrakia frigida TaxID=29902 RepID=UPI003FCBF488
MTRATYPPSIRRPPKLASLKPLLPFPNRYMLCRSTIQVFKTTTPKLIFQQQQQPTFLRTTSIVKAMSSSAPAQKSEQEWRTVLNKEQFRILREKGTERPGTGEYDKFLPAEGTFGCAGCGTPLYKAQHKFKSGCGWPAFFDAIPGAITRHEDRSLFSVRTEIVCSNCGGHLGHVFKGEGLGNPTDERHCVNSVSIKYDDKTA